MNTIQIPIEKNPSIEMHVDRKNIIERNIM